MTLFVDRIPERQRRDIFEFESSTSEAVGAAVEQTFFENPTTAVRRISELDEAMYGPYDYGSPGPGPGIAPRRIGPQTPLLTAEQARERTVEQGLELDIPEEGLPEGALNILMERKSAERKRQIILSSAPSGSFPITLAASFAASAIDPVNIASAFVPIFGEARIAGMLAKAGTAGGRFATRAGIGAVEGVAGAAIVEPLILAASAQDQADYDMSDSLLNVAFGGVLGGGLHSIGGYVSDLFNPIRIQHEAAIRPPETIEIPDGAAREMPSPEVQGESLSRPENIRPDLVDPINIEVELRRQMETDIANTAMARAQAEILPELIQELEPLAGTRIREVGDLKREQVDLERRQSMIDDTFKERAKDFQSEGLTRKRAEKAARESIAQEKAEIDQRLAAITNQLDETQVQGRAREDLERVKEGVIPERYLDRVNQRADEIRRGAQPKPLASAVKTAREIASEAPHSVRAAALQSAIAQAMDGQPVDVENLFKLMSKPDEALNAIKTQQRVYDKEAEAFSAKVDRIAKAEKDDFESLKASTEYEEQIVNEMVQQLNNRIDRDTYQKLLDRLRPAMGEMAEDNAKQMAAFLTAHARVMGTTPTQLLDRFVLGISREDGMPEGDVLNQAKTEGYEGDNIGEAEEWIRAKAKGLDMSTEARMERARAMGFDTGVVWKHFTEAGIFDAFDPEKRGETTLGNASSPGLAISSLVGDFFNFGSDVLGDTQLSGRVIEVFLPPKDDMYNAGSLGEFATDLENHAVYEMGIDYEKLQNPDDLYYDYLPIAASYTEKLKNNGYKGVVFSDEEFGGTSVAVFNNTDIRSISAAFDPDFKDSPNLLAQSSLFPESNRLSNLDKNGSTWKAILNENPELKNAGDTVTIYRATIGESIRPNDYVALNKAVADDHLANLAERGETGRIITQEVPIDSLLMANDATEFVFSPSQLLDQKNRGYLSISPEKYLNIGLLKDANASTFIHESGHAYLEIMRDSARLLEGRQLTSEQSAMLDDMTTLYDWLGVKSGTEIKVEHHEKFARGFERYAAEGVAPNSALRQAFENFKKWMMDVYRSLNELDVELTNEVRAVFDRMLGGDYATRPKQDARTVDARPRPEDGRGPEETNLDDINLANLIPELAEADALATNAQVYSRAWRAFAVCSLGA